MKLLLKYADSDELNAVKALLEANGIPAFINGEDTARLIPFSLTKASLWLHLDEQYEEALKLMEDPDYEVKNAVDMEAFKKVADSVVADPASTNRAFGDLAIFMVLILVALFILLQVLIWLRA
jgi:hypothetical protein